MSEEKNITANEAVTLTDEEVELVKDAINSVEMTEDEQLMTDINTGAVEVESKEDESAVIDAVVNDDGVAVPVNTDNEVDKLNEELAELLGISKEDLANLPETAEEIKLTEEAVEKNLESYGLNNISNISELFKVIMEYREREYEEGIKWFGKLPENIQTALRSSIPLDIPAANVKEALELAATELLSGLIRDASFDIVVNDFQKAMKEACDMTPVAEMLIEDSQTVYEKQIGELIEKHKAEENPNEEVIQELTKLQESYRDSYKLEGLLSAIKSRKVRVKDFDVDKYDRYVREFAFKYNKAEAKRKNFKLSSDYARCLATLKTKFEEYGDYELKAFMIAFFKYTMNFDSANEIDHIFMSSFIMNIIAMRFIRFNPGDKKNEFAIEFLSNVDKCIRAINKYPERDYAEILNSKITYPEN